ncbi:Proteasome subunit alpha type-6 [Saitoella coloradoensis]
MFRNMYDSDASTWSPQGRLHQVEYALEAIKQGSACVGLVSKNHAVLVALKRNAEELGSYQKKIIRLDSHIGLALAGLAPDARVLSNFLRQQSLSSRMLYNRPLPLSRLADSLADKAQVHTQHYGSRPYGVGLLIVGVDETGPHLWEFLPSGQCLEYYASALGARSQASRTYLERNSQSFVGVEMSAEELIMHGLKALRDSLPQDKELTVENTSVGVVGKGEAFKLIEGEDVRGWLEQLGQEGGAQAEGGQQGEAMETD